MNEIHPARVVVAEQRPAVRSALRLIVTDAVGMQVVAEAADAAELWGRVRTDQPEVLLLDWDMVAAQAGTVAALRESRPGLYIIALSGRPESEPDARRAGVDAFVSKTDPPERLVEALQSIDMGSLDLGGIDHG